MGTNALGYDIFTELVYGTRETLFIGLMSSLLTMLLGTAIGTAAAYRGFVGLFFNGLINIFVLLPRLITLIVLASFVGSSRWNLIALISAFSWVVGIARNVRSKVMHLNEQTFIENCVIQGYDRVHIAVHHILPNLYDVLISRFLLGVNSCIMMESTLSFLGMGLPLEIISWGSMLSLAEKALMTKSWWIIVIPGAFLVTLLMCITNIGNYLRKTANRKESNL